MEIDSAAADASRLTDAQAAQLKHLFGHQPALVDEAARRMLLDRLRGVAHQPLDDLAAAVFGGRTGVSERRLARLPLVKAARDLALVAERSLLESTGGLWRAAR